MKVVIKKSEAQEPFTFSFISNDGTTLVRSENYAAKKSALNGIASVKKNCTEASRYEMKESKNGKFFFNIKASNGQIVATSTLFATQDIRDAAISQMKSEAPKAEETEAEIEA